MALLNLFRKLPPKTVALVSLLLAVAANALHCGAAQDQAVATNAKQWKFAVVSIRRDVAGGPQRVGVATADGYQMENLFLGYLIMMAYAPQTGGETFYSSDQFVGMPDWLIGDDDRYDVSARVDESQLGEWHNPARQPLMLRSMLQSMLEDRLKLVVHRSTREAAVYQLVLGKNGAKFKETNSDELHPGARPMPGGGTLSREEKDDQMTIHYFGISMAQLVRFVLGDAGRPIQNRTGLTGKYDVTIVKPIPEGAGTPEVKPVETSAAEIADQLGLKLEPARGQVETLVIDHVERPSPN
jgi:uncharacterized protein (TIGR03435 family)